MLFSLVQIFTRDELVSESGHTEVHIRVNNTLLGLVTYWDLAKFETRLDQMRDIYQATPTPGSTSSLDSDSINLSGGEDQGDPFNDPMDNWVKDSVITPLPSPHRYNSLHNKYEIIRLLLTTDSVCMLAACTNFVDIFLLLLRERGVVLKNISALIHVVDHTCIHTCTCHFFCH